MIPTLLLLDGYRFFFYSNESNEPAHVHVEKGSGEGKIWFESTLEIAWMYRFSSLEENEIWEIAGKHATNFKTKWYEYFGK